jgi:hypothetical protein
VSSRIHFDIRLERLWQSVECYKHLVTSLTIDARNRKQSRPVAEIANDLISPTQCCSVTTQG